MNKKIHIYIPALILALVTLGSYAYFNANKNSKEITTNTPLNYIQFTGFEKNTIIEPIWKNEDGFNTQKIKIENDNQAENNITFNNEIIYRIQNADDVIDISVIKNGKTIIAEFSGLDKTSKVSVNGTLKENMVLTPVDWSGRLTLNHKLQTNNFCVAISNKILSTICHFQNNEVAS